MDSTSDSILVNLLKWAWIGTWYKGVPKIHCMKLATMLIKGNVAVKRACLFYPFLSRSRPGLGSRLEGCVAFRLWE